VSEVGRRLLCGRFTELDNLVSALAFGDRSLILVGGPAGVGKTSLVNVSQYVCYHPEESSEWHYDVPRLLPCFRAIEISKEDGVRAFIARVCCALANNMAVHYNTQGSYPPERLAEHISYWRDVKVEVSPPGGGFGVSAAGFGMQGQRSSAVTALQELQDPMAGFDLLLGQFLESEEVDGVILVLDNVDTLDMDYATNLLDAVRDAVLVRDGIHWIVIGQPSLAHDLNERSRRLSGHVKGSQHTLGHLTSEEFLHAIGERAHALRLRSPEDLQELRAFWLKIGRQIEVDGKVFPEEIPIEPPLTPGVHRAAYDFAHREFREAFRICGFITHRAFDTIINAGSLPPAESFQHLRTFCRDEAANVELDDRRLAVLEHAHRNGSVSTDAFAELGYDRPQGLASGLASLSRKGYLRLAKSGYTPTWIVEALALCGRLGMRSEALVEERYMRASRS
jgi:hypothetical protein